MRRLGGIPVDRSKSNQLVSQLVTGSPNLLTCTSLSRHRALAGLRITGARVSITLPASEHPRDLWLLDYPKSLLALVRHKR